VLSRLFLFYIISLFQNLFRRIQRIYLFIFIYKLMIRFASQFWSELDIAYFLFLRCAIKILYIILYIILLYKNWSQRCRDYKFIVKLNNRISLLLFFLSMKKNNPIRPDLTYHSYSLIKLCVNTFYKLLYYFMTTCKFFISRTFHLYMIKLQQKNF